MDTKARPQRVIQRGAPQRVPRTWIQRRDPPSGGHIHPPLPAGHIVLVQSYPMGGTEWRNSEPTSCLATSTFYVNGLGFRVQKGAPL
eukprot:2929095-Pyramimonas_sp.AAC.2